MMASKVRQASLLSDVRYLIHRHHSPLVEIRPSFIPNAGQGVFVNKRPIEKGRVVCLYPGIYTPGLPKHIAEYEESVYMANEVPPSGDMENNAYILNLSSAGGYIDGAALIGTDGRRLDENLSACANLVNHSPKSNVEMVAFEWSKVLEEVNYDDKHLMSCPNELRADGSPWYYDGLTGKIVKFPSSPERFESILYGAAFCSVTDLERGEEVLLNYKLKGPPYPDWAEDWYE